MKDPYLSYNIQWLFTLDISYCLIQYLIYPNLYRRLFISLDLYLYYLKSESFLLESFLLKGGIRQRLVFVVCQR